MVLNELTSIGTVTNVDLKNTYSIGLEEVSSGVISIDTAITRGDHIYIKEHNKYIDMGLIYIDSIASGSGMFPLNCKRQIETITNNFDIYNSSKTKLGNITNINQDRSEITFNSISTKIDPG